LEFWNLENSKPENMLRDIIKKEILDNITSPKFVFTFLLCTLLTLLSVWMGAKNYVTDKNEYAASVAMNRQVIENKTSQMEVLESLVLYRPPQALESVVNGVEESVGRAALMPKMLVDAKLIESKFGSNPVFAVFGVLDLMFIVKIVLSLFAILFTYDAIVGEKENGTLKLVLSNNIPRNRLILGKAIGGYVSLILPLLFPLFLSLILLLLYPNLALSGTDWLRLFLILVMCLVYLSVFFSLGLFISARALRSSTSFLVLLFIWVVFVMIIPKVAIVIAAKIKPVSSVHEITAKKNAVTDQAVTQYVNERMIEQIKLSRTTKDPAAIQEFEKKWQEKGIEMNRKVNEMNGALERDYQMRKKAQQSLAVNLSRVSPASALTFGSMSLARTGVDECDRFLASVNSYKQPFFKWFNLDAPSNSSMVGNQTKVKLDDMPRHSFEPESLRDSLTRALPDFALMLTMILVFFLGAYVSFLRYDVR
jgi:ABC-type transport system involved in multi-copper enzyme maturation permease subunit